MSCATALLVTVPTQAEPVAQDSPEAAELARTEDPAATPGDLDDADDPDTPGEATEEETRADAAAAAEQAALEAVVEQQASRDRHAAALSSYLGRPPTWIQTAARVNLGEFPTVADPTADAERTLRTLEWLLEQRERERSAVARAAARDGVERVAGEPDWLEALMPSTWLPLVREHRDTIVAGGAAVLLSTWLLNLLVRRAARRTRRWRRKRRRRDHRSRHASHAPAPPGAIVAAGEAPAVDAEARRHRRRRRRHRQTGRAADASIGWSSRHATPRS